MWKPEDVERINNYESFVERAEEWAISRGLNLQVFSWSGLLQNCVDEWKEGTQARERLCKVNTAISKTILNTEKIDNLDLTWQKDEQSAATCDIIDALIDGLIYVAVDSTKISSAVQTLAHTLGKKPEELSKSDIEALERQQEILDSGWCYTVIDPGMPTWVESGFLYPYFKTVCEQIDVLGFEPLGCITETFKELSTRRGTYSKEKGKWVKEEPKDGDPVYKANYAKCLYIDN